MELLKLTALLLVLSGIISIFLVSKDYTLDTPKEKRELFIFGTVGMVVVALLVINLFKVIITYLF